MEISFHYTIQGHPQNKTHYATIRIIKCTHAEQSKITLELPNLPLVAPATIGDSMHSNTKDKGETWTVVFTAKNFPTERAAADFIEKLHMDLAKITGLQTLEQFPLQLNLV